MGTSKSARTLRPCPGDGNGDGVVDNNDVTDFYQISNRWQQSSHYDFNVDGLTNIQDLITIYDNFGRCPQPPAGQTGKSQ